LEPWWKIDSDSCSENGGYLNCVRNSSDSHGVAEMVVKSGDPSSNGFSIKSVKLNDGNELEFSSYSSFASNNGKFDIPMNPECPTAVSCRSYMDVVFVLDTSTSVSSDEWTYTKNFVSNVVRSITIGPKDAYVGVIEFNGPTSCGSAGFCPSKDAEYIDIHEYGCVDSLDSTSCNGTQCKRYLEDYPFDANCPRDTTHRANVLMELTQYDVVNKIMTMKKTEGNTCQRYGLNKTYDMLFTSNTRCSNGVCPIPVVIVVTDGWDQCHASTLAAAERLRARVEEAGGFLIEIGVGLNNNYDREYLANLSSKLQGYSAAFSVDSYSRLESLIGNVLTPMCELNQLGGTCGPTCKGFCACSKCVCPMCGGNSTSICKISQCDMENADLGCTVGDVKCIDPVVEATKCYDMWCDAEETDPNKKCKAKLKDCKAEIEAQLHRSLSECEYAEECVNGTGCSINNIVLNHTYCQNKAAKCQIGTCSGARGCTFTTDDCKDSPLYEICTRGILCNNVTGQCEATQPRFCNVDECYQIVGGTVVPVCASDDPCIVSTCDKTKPEGQRCTNTSKCGVSSNACKKMTCDNGQCGEQIYDTLDCSSLNTYCTTYTCDPDYNDGKGGCKPELVHHEETECMKYECDEVEGWKPVPRCTTNETGKIAKCLSGGVCYIVDISSTSEESKGHDNSNSFHVSSAQSVEAVVQSVLIMIFSLIALSHFIM